jgi:hypothetical protein
VLRARLFTFVAVLVAGSLGFSGAAFAADPLGLTLDGGAGESLGLGTDTIAVWVCRIPGTADPKSFTPGEVAAWANDEIAPFFSLVSRGRYTPVFEAAGTFTRSTDCLNEAIGRTTDARFSNAMVMDDTDNGGGLGGDGIWYLVNGQVQSIAPESPPAISGRGFYVRGGMFGLPATAAHEVGHTLAWPHSGSEDSGLEQYDNIADLMSGHGVDNFCPVSPFVSRGPCEITHTLAFNRYASGWIDPGAISLVTKPVAGVDLAGPETGGLQFALVPSADPLVFSTVEARPASGYDAVAGFEGVVLHTVDQAASCASTICWGLNRRQYPAVGAPGSTDHILGVGESVVLHGVTVSVDAATAGGYTVSFQGTPQGCAMGPNPFGDVSRASFAFNDIGCIRLLGITTGTSPTTYAPSDTVTREQMAAFLARLHRTLGGSCSNAPTPFVDIGGSFAAADIACIYALGVTTGVSSNRYDPKGTVTREQMAAFLGRLWRDALGGSCSNAPTPFVDIGGSFAAADIACIYALGITTGTSPTTYSPGAAVTREQMASFLARFWKRA